MASNLRSMAHQRIWMARVISLSETSTSFNGGPCRLLKRNPMGKKKGADGGIDGLIYFRSDARTTERAIVSVKGGGVSVPMVRDLKGVLDREKAPIGVFLTLEAPTRPMEKEAASAGFYTLGNRQYPRLQIITIEQALAGHKPAIPLVDTGAAFKRPAREASSVQTKLDF